MKLSSIKIRRMSKAMTQWQVAQQLGISESTLSRVESGKKALPEKIFKKLCQILACSSDELSETAVRRPMEGENEK